MAREPASTSRPKGSKLNLLIVALMFAGVIGAVVLVNGREGADPSGKDALAPALAVVVVGMLALMVNNARWVRRAERADLEAAAGRAATLRDPAADPGRASAEEVQAALALDGAAPEDLAARREMWSFTRRSTRWASLVTVLVIVLMVPAILSQDPRLIVLAAIPIVLVALVLSVNTLRPGGTVDQAYEHADRVMAPLGLRTVERPQWMPIPYADGSLHGTVVGPTVLGGERHGREVEVWLDGARSFVAVGCTVPAFTASGERSGRLTCADDAPPAVRGALGTLAPAPVWSGARIEGGEGRILVSRRRRGPACWQHDLWLAERLAGAC
jgi:hypothetical protein